MSRRRTEPRVYRIATTPNKAKVRQMSEMGARIAIDECCISARCARIRRSGGSPADSVLEKQVRTNKPGPSRNPHSHSGLLAQVRRQRRRISDPNPRMPGLEGGAHITVLLMD